MAGDITAGLLALLEGMAKQMVVLSDASIDDLLVFLDAADAHGNSVQTVVGLAGGVPRCSAVVMMFYYY